MPVLDLWKNQSGDCEMKTMNHYTSLSRMFTYPEQDLQGFSDTWMEIALKYDPAFRVKLEPFIKHLHDSPLAFQQEYYVSTFDVQALCFLDVGYVLFGEDYKRGNFLVHMKREQEKAGNDCGCEMPDHLPNILTLIPKLEDEEFVEELVVSLLIPAIQEMIAKFGSNRNFYKDLLELVAAIMEMDFPGSKFERFKFVTQGKTDLLNSMPMGCEIPG
jgi:nitrate reductase molybdenum cofactor assembly chaperone